MRKLRPVEVTMPQELGELLTYVGAGDIARGGMPGAIGRLLSAIASGSVVLFRHLPPEEYAVYRRSMMIRLDELRQVIASANPEVVMDTLLAIERDLTERKVRPS